ncbi:unnamed protein product [Clonostachys rosea]|uniref:Uncharacterized protein n=1 Tax=Bionectria ochroleuca TaxID=29856 RepID=A0ABY6TPF2_BIOOC|nr:unnamed protein product [Clonostachys rosea]
MPAATGVVQGYPPYHYGTQNNHSNDNVSTSPSASFASGTTKTSSTPPSVLEQSDMKQQQAGLNPASNSWVPHVGVTNGHFTQVREMDITNMSLLHLQAIDSLQPVSYAPGHCGIPMPQFGGMPVAPPPPSIHPMNNMNNMNNGPYPYQHMFHQFNQGHNGIKNGTAAP